MWEQDKVLILIDFYKRNTFLWDPKDMQHKIKSMRNSAYAEIALILDCEIRDIPSKWLNVKNTFTKESKKVKDSKGEYRSKWYAFDSLSFLSGILPQESEEIPIESSINMMNYCRSCMEEDREELIDVFSTSIGGGSPLSEVFYLMTGISITENDELPIKICEKCKGFLEIFLQFREKATETQSNLNDLLAESKNQAQIQKDVKQKPKNIRKVRAKKSPKMHQCTFCEKSFKDKNYLAKHISFHENLRKFLCDLCGKGFNSEETMKTHRLIHTGEKPFTCKFCDGKFRQASALSIHIAAKHKEKKSKCPDCGKCFTIKFEMERHRRVHTGERPYACSECDKTFSKRVALNEHLKVFHRGFKYTCEICSTELSSASHLARHMKIHSNDKPFKCSFCPQEFSRSDYLKKHLAGHRTVYGDMNPEHLLS